MKIYQIDSSARKEGSTSSALAKNLITKIKNTEDEGSYRTLDNAMECVSGREGGGVVRQRLAPSPRAARCDPCLRAAFLRATRAARVRYRQM